MPANAKKSISPLQKKNWAENAPLLERLRFWMAVSRILSGPRLAPRAWTAICLAPRLSGGTVLANCDYYPGDSTPLSRAERAGNPYPPVLSCTALGFSCPLACARGGGLLPRLFTRSPRLSPEGGLFSVTLSVGTGLRPRLPRVLRGTPPCGVRTFLPMPASRPAQSDRPPSETNLYFAGVRTQARTGWFSQAVGDMASS